MCCAAVEPVREEVVEGLFSMLSVGIWEKRIERDMKDDVKSGHTPDLYESGCVRGTAGSN